MPNTPFHALGCELDSTLGLHLNTLVIAESACVLRCCVKEGRATAHTIVCAVGGIWCGKRAAVNVWCGKGAAVANVWCGSGEVIVEVVELCGKGAVVNV